MAIHCLRTSQSPAAGSGAAGHGAAAGGGHVGKSHHITAVTAITGMAARITGTVVRGGAPGGKLGHARKSAVYCRDEVSTLVAECEAARFQHVASQKMTGQREAVGYVMADGLGVMLMQECRQPQHLVGPGLARSARYGSA